MFRSLKRHILVIGTVISFSAFAWLDTDQDGVPDLKDACPNSIAGDVVMANGCVNTPQLVEPEVITQALPETDNIGHETVFCLHTTSGALFPADCVQNDVAHVLFEFAKSDVDDSQRNVLANAAYFLKQYPVRLILIGHADDIGSAEFNQLLSEARANNVKRILVEDYGFPTNRFTTKGMGLTDPIADNRQHEGRRLNRRVEFIVQVE